MVRMRLLPIVLFGVGALFVLKVLGLATGEGSFAVGPAPAVAAGGGGNAAPAADDDFANTAVEPPVDLRREFKEQQQKAAAAGGHGKAEGDGKAPAADGHGAPAADAQAADAQAAAPADAHAASATPDGGHGTPPNADGKAASSAAGQAGAPAAGDAAAATEHAAPADAKTAPADAHGAPAADAHGGGDGEDDGLEGAVTTVRPEEFKPEGSKSETAVLQSLSDRRSDLDKREDDLMLRLKLLEAAEARLQKRVDELKSIETQISAARQTEEATASERVKGLATMYENMKPKAAAAVFDTLDLPILLDLAKSMQPKKMAAVLAQMSPANAARLTTALAARPDEPVRTVSAGEPGAPGVGQTAPGLDALPKIMPAAPAN
ncbi:MotE family protein [Chthonobacter rhizosphaerae]|uniref:MotE family protein n=1 Tax=Chthonobacter rhizosphaerae TaxID=2735553 RepID=UPI0015EF42E3|nr:hypothetical protein [Chthonobacter rhizosphaerae]